MGLFEFDGQNKKAPEVWGLAFSNRSHFFCLQLARGFLAFGAGFPLLAPFHAHASLLAFASCHKTPLLLFIEVQKIL
jgi:hypothetical protein